MSFPDNALEIARSAMEEINPNLVDPYTTVIDFLSTNPEFAPKATKTAPLGSSAYIEKLAQRFSDGRATKQLKPPQTIQDPIISVILGSHGNYSADQLQQMQAAHSLAMGAENLTGDLLEDYIAENAEPAGWVQCSGYTTKKADFIKRSDDGSNSWTILQIKNRDNSENSASRSVREGTEIQKWHRSFAKKEGFNWHRFPDEQVAEKMSEEGFQKFVIQQITTSSKI
ncbi:SinI family restriction endonuclease [Pseudomonas rustica]|uniref:SinI family restriction endonuclease n=1 Tax=Pseudomonas rustica TaxID=2827099 RepID=A0ABS5N2K8_9PSED|nr:SinI family restriction endonuclease [Pseudomonas rustica]MBS4080539.1 SinI family restriction endonuclease [Pseudomonas rustica]